MPPVKALDNDAVTVYYHPDTKIVHHEFHTSAYGQPFRDALSKGVDLMKRNGGCKWLSDDRNNSALPQDDATWAQTIWFPAVKAAGWKHWAVVMPAKVLGQLNMKQWMSLYSGMGINARAFSDPKEAMAWLAAQ